MKLLESIYKLNYSDYDFIKKSLIDYITGNVSELNKKLFKYKNMPEFVLQKNYTLYRGIILDDFDMKKYIKGFDYKNHKLGFSKYHTFVSDSKFNVSFTTNINIARRFAYNGLNLTTDDEYGVLLKKNFLPNEILFDIDYINENHPILFNFLKRVSVNEENEVIVFPKNMNLEIIKIYK